MSTLFEKLSGILSKDVMSDEDKRHLNEELTQLTEEDRRKLEKKLIKRLTSRNKEIIKVWNDGHNSINDI